MPRGRSWPIPCCARRGRFASPTAPADHGDGAAPPGAAEGGGKGGDRVGKGGGRAATVAVGGDDLGGGGEQRRRQQRARKGQDRRAATAAGGRRGRRRRWRRRRRAAAAAAAARAPDGSRSCLVAATPRWCRRKPNRSTWPTLPPGFDRPHTRYELSCFVPDGFGPADISCATPGDRDAVDNRSARRLRFSSAPTGLPVAATNACCGRYRR